MRIAKIAVTLGLLAALVAAAGLLYFKSPSPVAPRPVTVAAAPQTPQRQAEPVPPLPGPAGVQASSTPLEVAPQPSTIEQRVAPKPAAQKKQPIVQPPQTPAPQPGKPPVQDELARVALSLVGADPQAEEYWIGAINDPTLSAHERQDLIEDLNEDGLSDPKHPSLDDLPLILNRLRLIQELAPYAMDQVNADAFAEAGKDLLNMYAQLTQQ